MNESRSFRAAAAVSALVLVAVAIVAGWTFFRGNPALLRDAVIGDNQITPNADGDQDVTRIDYELTRNAKVSIYFENDQRQRYYFRQDEPRGVGEFSVLFSGIVDGYKLPGEEIDGQILARLLPDGNYTWTIEATDEQANTEVESGQIEILQSDPILPELRNFTMDKKVFSPNQDGIDDRIQLQFFLPKEVEQTRVFLVTPEGAELPVAELERGVPANAPGRHYFDYEAGVDNKAAPPPDGTYPVFAVAVDTEGQKIQVEDELTIEYGGVPRAEIISPVTGDTVEFSATAIALCDTITFTLTVQNYGETPIRTTGPSPGTTYDSDWNYNTLGWHTESGAWRVAIGYENELTNYPYRWAVGNSEELVKIGDHYYLMPGQRAVITGSIRVVGPFGERNPQPLWAGLIHEDVEISEFNNRVDPHEILVDMPDPGNVPVCAERVIPARDDSK